MFHIVFNGKYIGYDDFLVDFGDFMVTDAEWQAKAKRLLKSELKRAGVGYRELAARLQAMGVAESEANIANKISRGGFSAVFLLQALTAIGCKNLAISFE